MTRPGVGESWWEDLDGAVLECVARRGVTSPEDIGVVLGMSPAGVSSVLAMLAAEGRLRITGVAPVDRRRATAA
jgi:hypothetical protein